MRRMTCLLLILVTMNGCMQWTSSHLPLAQALSPDPGSKTIRVWLLDQRSIELRQPTVTDSTIAGISTDLRAELVVIPRDSVRKVEILATDGGASGLIVVAAVVGLLAVVASGFSGAMSGLGRGIATCAVSCR